MLSKSCLDCERLIKLATIVNKNQFTIEVLYDGKVFLGSLNIPRNTIYGGFDKQGKGGKKHGKLKDLPTL